MTTNEELAAALGVSVRTIPRMRKRGLPAPTDGEDLQEWAKRAEAWRRESRKPPGRPVDKSIEEQDADARWRLARAIKIELEVEEKKGNLHSKAQCEAAHARRCHELTISFLGLGQAAGEIASNQQVSFSDKFSSGLMMLASLNFALFAFNMLPLLPLDGGHVAGGVYEAIKKGVYRLLRKPNPGPADTALLMPLTWVVFILLMAMSALIIIADVVNPISF